MAQIEVGAIEHVDAAVQDAPDETIFETPLEQGVEQAAGHLALVPGVEVAGQAKPAYSKTLPSKEETQHLFAEMTESNPRSRETLIINFMPLALKVARRFEMTTVPFDDLFQIACTGLIQAVDRYDMSQGTTFSSFAIPTMEGKIKNHLRDNWNLHVERSLQEHALRVSKLRNAAEAEGKELTVADVAEKLGVDEKKATQAMDASRYAYSVNSLDEPVRSKEGEVIPLSVGESVSDPESEWAFDAADTKVDFEKAVGKLSDKRMPKIIEYRLAEMSQAEIAKELGVSQMQISRLMRRAQDELAASMRV